MTKKNKKEKESEEAEQKLEQIRGVLESLIDRIINQELEKYFESLKQKREEEE